MNNQEIIKVEDLTRNYRMIYAENPEDREIKVLKGLNFAVKTEEFVGSWENPAVERQRF